MVGNRKIGLFIIANSLLKSWSISIFVNRRSPKVSVVYEEGPNQDLLKKVSTRTTGEEEYNNCWIATDGEV